MCRSRSSEVSHPINLDFTTKTTVIIVDRQRLYNGYYNYIYLSNIMSSSLRPSLPPPPPPPPPPPSLPTSSTMKVKVDESKDDEWKLKKEQNHEKIIKREEFMQGVNSIFNETYMEQSLDLKERVTKVNFANADCIVDITEDRWYEEDEDLTSDNDSNEVSTENVSTAPNDDKGEEEEKECSKTYYMCRSKDSETPVPINLCFPAKTNVIIVDRRKTDNGSHDFLCSLNVSREGKQKLLKQRNEEGEEELNSLPKGNIAQILKQLEKQQDDEHDNEN